MFLLLNAAMSLPLSPEKVGVSHVKVTWWIPWIYWKHILRSICCNHVVQQELIQSTEKRCTSLSVYFWNKSKEKVQNIVFDQPTKADFFHLVHAGISDLTFGGIYANKEWIKPDVWKWYACPGVPLLSLSLWFRDTQSVNWQFGFITLSPHVVVYASISLLPSVCLDKYERGGGRCGRWMHSNVNSAVCLQQYQQQQRGQILSPPKCLFSAIVKWQTVAGGDKLVKKNTIWLLFWWMQKGKEVRQGC